MDKKQKTRELIEDILKVKSVNKQNVYRNTFQAFNDLKEIVQKVADDLKAKMEKVDKRLKIEFRSDGDFKFEIQVAGDLVVFYMHTNVFDFDKSHAIWKTSYVKEDNYRSFCGMISIYNFLSDSFKYNRSNDVGYMIGRMFINKDNHFFIEGKRQLGFLYNDFSNLMIDKKRLLDIVESAILYSLSFDLFTPPFESHQQISISEIQEANLQMQITTGKRLGFRFQADSDQIES